MFSPPEPKRSKFSLPVVALFLFALGAGGGILYLFTSETSPSWLSYLLPSTSYAPSENERKATGNTRQASDDSPANFNPSVTSPTAVKEEDAPTLQPSYATPPPATSATRSPQKTDTPVPSPSYELSEPPSTSEVTAQPQLPSQDRADTDTQNNSPALPATQENDHASVITYGKAKPVDSNPSIVRGSISDGQGVVIPLPRPDGAAKTGTSPAKSPTADTPLPIPQITEITGPDAPPPSASGKDDSIVTFAAVDSLAKFLAENFWPVGTHALAGKKPITTATFKWANVQYGTQLPGFQLDGTDARQKRQTLLDYIFTPEMITKLYGAYAQRFFDAFDREARALVRGDNKKPLNAADLGDMYDVYAVVAQNLVETIYAYMYTPGVRSLVSDYSTAVTEAAKANKEFSARMAEGKGNDAEIGRRYQTAIRQRDSKRTALASTLRKHGAPQSMDEDSLAYIAQWIYRRGENAEASLTALAKVLHSGALSFRTIGTQYDEIAYSQGLR